MNSGDTTWILICTALVLLMTPGLALFYGGLVRERSAINTIKMCFIAMGIIAIEWALVGYSLAFSPGNGLLGGLDWIGLSSVDAAPSATYGSTIPHLAFMAFQMMFAIITPALISGAVVERMRFKAYVAFIGLWSLVVYVPLAHWVWGDGGWLGALGALDFAGGTVVHISAGVSALVAAIILGPRQRTSEEAGRPHNVPFVVLGASLLWFGWFGFNAGSALAADGIAVTAMVTTMLAAAAALSTWYLLDTILTGRASAIGAAIGAVVGLVAITPAAGFVTPLSAIAIGSIAAAISRGAMAWLGRVSIDDALDVFACHGLGGITGALLTGVFASTAVNPAGADGLLHGGTELLGAQALSVLVAALLAAGGTAFILIGLKAVMGVRASAAAEVNGIDEAEHGEAAYAMELIAQRNF